jgi:hypothetical protein
MPRGAASFQKTSEAQEARREEMNGPRADYFKLEGGQIAIVRFLEQGDEIAYYVTHRVPMPGRPYPQDVPCLDQNDDGTPCPGCQSEHKGVRARSTKGLHNVIHRGGLPIQTLNQQIEAFNAQAAASGQAQYPTYALAPVYKRNEWGSPEKDQQSNQKIILGWADGVFLWKASKGVFEQILSKDQTYRGLMSREFTIRRQGATKDDTKYFIEPLNVDGGEEGMTQEDFALTQAKYDLDAIMRPPSYEEFAKLLSGQPSQMTSAGPQPTFQRFAPVADGANAFMGGAPVRGPGFGGPPAVPAPPAPPVAPVPQAAPVPPQMAPVVQPAPQMPPPPIPQQ